MNKINDNINNVTVCIPVYKEIPDAGEVASLERCCTILANHVITIFTYPGLKVDFYINILSRHKILFTIKYFDKKYFADIDGYNDLLMDPVFYKSLKEFEFILIYQLDAFVFSDDLTYWCGKKYDYIGAPWFEGWENSFGSKNIIGVGNGGFSLRNCKKSFQISKRIYRIKRLKRIWNYFRLNSLFSYEVFLKKVRYLFKINNTEYIIKILKLGINEDHYWGGYVAKAFNDFAVADVNDAIRFSFEANPSYLYQLTGSQLPFGCHAWRKYEPEFWEPIISEII